MSGVDTHVIHLLLKSLLASLAVDVNLACSKEILDSSIKYVACSNYSINFSFVVH